MKIYAAVKWTMSWIFYLRSKKEFGGRWLVEWLNHAGPSLLFHFHFALQIFKRQTIGDVSGPSAAKKISSSNWMDFSNWNQFFTDFLIEQIILTRDATRENIQISTSGDVRKEYSNFQSKIVFTVMFLIGRPRNGQKCHDSWPSSQRNIFRFAH